MNKTNKMILGLMLGTLVVGCQKDYYLDDLQAAQEEITRLKTTVKGLQNNLDNAEYQNSNLLAQLNAASDALSTAQGVNIELTANINTLSDIISDLETQINELNTEINNLSANDQANQDIIASLNEEIAALQTEIDNYEPVIVEVIREVEVIVERVVEVSVDADVVDNTDRIAALEAALKPQLTIDSRTDNVRVPAGSYYFLEASSSSTGAVIEWSTPLLGDTWIPSNTGGDNITFYTPGTYIIQVRAERDGYTSDVVEIEIVVYE